MAILSALRECSHIIRLYDFFDEPDHFYLVLETMYGGELFDRIVQKSYYNEKDARKTCKVLLEAIDYCHERRVAHRDLKPENLLLRSETDDSSIKIADFGFAKVVKSPQSLKTQCGTPVSAFMRRAGGYGDKFCVICSLIHAIRDNLGICGTRNSGRHTLR